MGLKPGYKQTDVGVIPEDWEVKPLSGSIAIIHGYGFESQYFRSMGSYWLTTPGHFYESGGFRDIGNKQKFYDGPLPDGYLLSAGDLIVAMTEQADGLLGSAAFIPPHGNYLHNQRLGKVKVLSSNISIKYLYRVFNSRVYRNKVRETAAGTKVKHTSPSKLLEILVALPPTKAEQEAIAEALSDADALIESVEQLIAKKRQIKQGAVQELLRPKDGWLIQKLEDIAAVIDPHPSHRAPAAIPNGIPFVGIGDLNEDGDIIGNKVRTVHEAVFDEHQMRYSLKDELIGLGRVASIGKVVKLKDIGEKYAVSPTLGVIKGTKVRRDYLFYALKSRWVADQFTRIMSGSTRSSVGMVVLRKLDISLPSEEKEQTAIAAVLSDMDAEIAALEAKLAKARQVKQGMMHNLLTGSIRLV